MNNTFPPPTDVAVIGLGYVGLPLAVAFAEAGYTVHGIDLDQRKVDALNVGESYIGDVPAARKQLEEAMEASSTRGDRELYAAKLERIRAQTTQ